jgi:hypothetical protein
MSEVVLVPLPLEGGGGVEDPDPFGGITTRQRLSLGKRSSHDTTCLQAAVRLPSGSQIGFWRLTSREQQLITSEAEEPWHCKTSFAFAPVLFNSINAAKPEIQSEEINRDRGCRDMAM